MMFVWYWKGKERKGYRYNSHAQMFCHGSVMVRDGWTIDYLSGAEKRHHCDCCDGSCDNHVW